jgi:hypothetical protein
MPNEALNDDPSLPSSEDLDVVAKEQQIANETTINNVNESIHIAKCFRCDATEFLSLCRHCGHEFCNNHRSKYSDQYRYLCIAPSNLGIDFLPLEEEDVDDAGKTVVHHGRRIKLIGEGWPSNMQMVNSLDDAGLEIFIAERQRLLQEAIQTAEYHRITLSHAEFTKEYKRHSKAAKLQRRYTEIQQGAVRLSGKTHRMGPTKKQQTEDEKLMALLGLDAEQFKAFKKVMNKL